MSIINKDKWTKSLPAKIYKQKTKNVNLTSSINSDSNKKKKEISKFQIKDEM